MNLEKKLTKQKELRSKDLNGLGITQGIKSFLEEPILNESPRAPGMAMRMYLWPGSAQINHSTELKLKMKSSRLYSFEETTSECLFHISW